MSDTIAQRVRVSFRQFSTRIESKERPPVCLGLLEVLMEFETVIINHSDLQGSGCLAIHINFTPLSIKTLDADARRTLGTF